MLWYHDHTMGIERLNQYAGLFGALSSYVTPSKIGWDFRRDPMRIPLVLCDRIFRADGQLEYPTSGDPETPWVPEVYGDTTLVNGMLFPYLEIEPVVYRFRILNASNARVFLLVALRQGRLLYRIGSDQGLLPAPVPVTTLTLAPAERADVLLDFRAAAEADVDIAQSGGRTPAISCGVTRPTRVRCHSHATPIGRENARRDGCHDAHFDVARIRRRKAAAHVDASRRQVLARPRQRAAHAGNGRNMEVCQSHRGHPPHPPAPRSISDSRQAALRCR